MKTTELNCKSLMIGDLVSYNGTPIKVDNIHEDCINYSPDIPYVQEEFFIDIADVKPISLTLEILERIGFYWGYTSSEEDFINNMPEDIPVSMPAKHWCYDNENGGEITIELPNESDGGHITVSNNDRWIEFIFDKPISLHELQQMLRVCGLNELADNLKLEEQI